MQLIPGSRFEFSSQANQVFHTSGVRELVPGSEKDNALICLSTDHRESFCMSNMHSNCFHIILQW